MTTIVPTYDKTILRAAYSQVLTKARTINETSSTIDTFNKLQNEPIKVIHHYSTTDIDLTTAKIINWYAAKQEKFEVFFQELPKQLEMARSRFSQAPKLDEEKKQLTSSFKDKNTNELNYISLGLLGLASAIFLITKITKIYMNRN